MVDVVAGGAVGEVRPTWRPRRAYSRNRIVWAQRTSPHISRGHGPRAPAHPTPRAPPRPGVGSERSATAVALAGIVYSAISFWPAVFFGGRQTRFHPPFAFGSFSRFGHFFQVHQGSAQPYPGHMSTPSPSPKDGRSSAPSVRRDPNTYHTEPV